MNEQDKTLFDFAEQVRRKSLAIMALPVSGRDRTEDAGLMALEIMNLAMKMKTYAEMRETLNDPGRYDLSALPERAAFDE